MKIVNKSWKDLKETVDENLEDSEENVIRDWTESLAVLLIWQHGK